MSNSRQDKTKESDNGTTDDISNALEKANTLLEGGTILGDSLLRVIKRGVEELEKELRKLDQQKELRQRQHEALCNALRVFLMGEEELKSRRPENIADATALILRDYNELELGAIQVELHDRYQITVERKILRTILDRWMKGKAAYPRFRRTKPSTYALIGAWVDWEKRQLK